MSKSTRQRERISLRAIADTVRERHRHVVIGRLNDHDVKIAVNQDPSEWHGHPNSDEFFLTLEGELRLEFRNGEPVTLRAGEGLIVEAGAIHRTIPTGRTVNLLVERTEVTTVFEGRDGSRKGSGAQEPSTTKLR